MHNAGSMVIADALRKTYDGVVALDGLSFEVAAGELFGLIGPDGAGKTTLFRILTTLMRPDAGQAFVDGLHVVDDYRALRRRLGYMPGRFSLYTDLSVEENLHFFATVFGTTVDANYDLIRPIYEPLAPFKRRRAGQLSGGMKQKLALSCALIHRPRVLVLDEPTTGVDAVSRKEFWEMLARLRADGITILVSTPYMDEARRCDRIALIQNGRLLGVDTPARIEAGYDAPLFAVSARDRRRLIEALRAFPHARWAYAFGDSVHYTDRRPQADAAEIARYLESIGLDDVSVHPIPAGVEDVFMARMLETG